VALTLASVQSATAASRCSGSSSSPSVVGYFVLEGFDFGVGILLGVLGRDDLDRRVLINTIGPVWTATRCGCS